MDRMVGVPKDSYYGPQTRRAMDNFPISGITPPLEFIQTVALIKYCAALINKELGLLGEVQAEALATAAAEIFDGKFADQFAVDVFQTGSGTSTNMNMNEVIAVRANEILTGRKQDKEPIHPNDHVNLGQSSNDVIPSAIHISAVNALHKCLLPALADLQAGLAGKAEEFKDVVKIGRTHLQDAVPIRLGHIN